MAIIMNGMIDAIKELREQAKCPFCDKQLEFAEADSWGRDDKFKLQCRECALEFTLIRQKCKKETKWVLGGVRKAYFPYEEKVK